MPIIFKDDIPVEEVRRLLSYRAETGDLFWIERVNSHVPKGGRAGHLHARFGYIHITIREKKYKAHRLAWLLFHGEWPSGEVDHINGDKADNRIENLRAASTSQNRCNSRTMKNNTSGRKGVYLDKRSGGWFAKIQIDHKDRYIGLFHSFDDACAARANAEKRYHGEFARNA